MLFDCDARVYFLGEAEDDGWVGKGTINDPHLTVQFDINFGLRQARSLLLPRNNTETNEAYQQYATDYVKHIPLRTWFLGGNGARTAEARSSPRVAKRAVLLTSALKGGTDSNLKIAIDAIGAATFHHFLSVIGQAFPPLSISGNPICHVILRGERAELWCGTSASGGTTACNRGNRSNT